MTSLQKKILVLLGLIVADSLFTVYLVTHGHGEANPMLNWYMQYVGVIGMAITKIAVSTILLILVYYGSLTKNVSEKYLSWGIWAYVIIFTISFTVQFII